MRDARVTVLDATTIAADGATNGADIDLLGDYTGDHKHGTSMYGLPIEILAKSVVTGTGDGFTVTVKVQVAPDNAGAAGVYVDHNVVGTFTIDTDGNFMKDGAIYQLTRAKLQTRIRTDKPWARIVATAAGITGGEKVTLQAWVSDGTTVFADTGVIS